MKNELIQTSLLQQVQRLTPLQIRYVRMLEMSEPELMEEISKAVEEMPALGIKTDVSDTTQDEMPSYRFFTPSSAPEDVAAGNNLSETETLYSHVLSQLNELSLNDTEKFLAEIIVGNINDAGYLERTPQQISDDILIQTGQIYSPKEINRVIDIIRSLDPPGIASRNLQESLLNQLEKLGQSPSRDLALNIVRDLFDHLSLKHYDVMMSRTASTKSQLQEALSVIRSLNPRPATGFSTNGIESNSQLILPELTVEIVGDKAIVNVSGKIPELEVEQSFSIENDKLAGAIGRSHEEALTFIRSRRDEAALFIKALQMRQTTLLNIMTAIANRQLDFFRTGDDNKLRPMLLKDIAADTGYDISTVSRSTSGKYVSTPFGVFPLKHFFNEKSPATSGDDNAAHTTAVQVMNEIKAAIETEDNTHPLTDDEIKDILKEKGYDVARRTVAKYRERLEIPVARMRKELN